MGTARADRDGGGGKEELKASYLLLQHKITA